MIASDIILDETFQRLVIWDMLWITLSVLFVYLYLSFHLKSFFLSSVVLLLMFISFPLTAMVTNGVMGVNYMS